VSILVMGPGQIFLTQSVFGARVGSGIFGLYCVWIWKISPKNHKFFNFFPSDQKITSSKMGWHLIHCRSKFISSGWVKKYQSSYLLQVKSMLESGQGPSLPIFTEILNFQLAGLKNQLLSLARLHIWPQSMQQ